MGITKAWKEAIAKTEGDDYSAINKETGALGRYQFLPDIARAMLGRRGIDFNADSFLTNPKLQEEAFDEYYNYFKERGGNKNNFYQYAMFHVSGKLDSKDLSGSAAEYTSNYIKKADDYFSNYTGLDTNNSKADQLYTALSKKYNVSGDFDYDIMNDYEYRKKAINKAISEGLIKANGPKFLKELELELGIRERSVISQRFEDIKNKLLSFGKDDKSSKDDKSEASKELGDVPAYTYAFDPSKLGKLSIAEPSATRVDPDYKYEEPDKGAVREFLDTMVTKETVSDVKEYTKAKLGYLSTFYNELQYGVLTSDWERFKEEMQTAEDKMLKDRQPRIQDYVKLPIERTDEALNVAISENIKSVEDLLFIIPEAGVRALTLALETGADAIKEQPDKKQVHKNLPQKTTKEGSSYVTDVLKYFAGFTIGATKGFVNFIVGVKVFPVNAAYNTVHGSGLTYGLNKYLWGKEFADEVYYDALQDVVGGVVPTTIGLRIGAHPWIRQKRNRSMNEVEKMVEAYRKTGYNKEYETAISLMNKPLESPVSKSFGVFTRKNLKMSVKDFETLPVADRISIYNYWKDIHNKEYGSQYELFSSTDLIPTREITGPTPGKLLYRDGTGKERLVLESSIHPETYVINPKYANAMNRVTKRYGNKPMPKHNLLDKFEIMKVKDRSKVVSYLKGNTKLTPKDFQSMVGNRATYIGLLKDVYKPNIIKEYDISPQLYNLPIFVTNGSMTGKEGGRNIRYGGWLGIKHFEEITDVIYIALSADRSFNIASSAHELAHLSNKIDKSKLPGIKTNLGLYTDESNIIEHRVGTVSGKSIDERNEYYKTRAKSKKTIKPYYPLGSLVENKKGEEFVVSDIIDRDKNPRFILKDNEGKEVKVTDIKDYSLKAYPPNPNQLSLFPRESEQLKVSWKNPSITAPPIISTKSIKGKQEVPNTPSKSFIWLMKQLKESKKEAKKKRTEKRSFIDNLEKKWVDISGPVKRALKDLKDSRADAAIRYKDLGLGASAYSRHVYNNFVRSVYNRIDRNINKTLNSLVKKYKKNPKDIPDYKTLFTIMGDTPRDIFDNFVVIRRLETIIKYKGSKRDMPIIGKNHRLLLQVAKEFPIKYPELYQTLLEASDLYHKSLKECTLDVLLREGLISVDSYDALVSKGFYSPIQFIDLIDPTIKRNIGGRNIDVKDSGLKALSEAGSSGKIETNSEMLVFEAISRTQRRIFRNRANTQLYALAMEKPDNGIVAPGIFAKRAGKKPSVPAYQSAPSGWSDVHCMDNGVRRVFYMKNRFYNDWIQHDPAINYEHSKWISVLTGNRIIKATATGYNPWFAIRNLPRDMAYIWLTTDVYSPFLPVALGQMAHHYVKTAPESFGFHPIEGFKDYVDYKNIRTAWYKMFSRHKEYVDYLKEGGGQNYLTYQGMLSIHRGRQVPVISTTLDMLSYLNSTSEIWSRMALRDAAFNKYGDPNIADHIARTYLDFNQGGSAAKVVEHVVPYFNASVQATRGLFRAAKNDKAKFIIKASQLMMLSSGLYMANKKNKDCYDAIPDKTKNSSWCITTPLSYIDKRGERKYVYWTVAKDQGQRAMSAIAEGLTAKVIGDDFDWHRAWESALQAVPYVPASGLAPTIKAIFGYTANYDFWRMSPIGRGGDIPLYMEAEEGRTPGLFIQMGKAAKAVGFKKFSPDRANYAFNQYFTENNPYVQLVNERLGVLLNSLPQEDRDEACNELVAPLLRKSGLVRTASKAHIYYEKKEKLSREERGERYQVNKGLQLLLKQEKKATTKSDKKRHELAIMSYINEQEPLDRTRLLNRYTSWKQLQSLNLTESELIFWLGCSEVGLDKTRAAMFALKLLELEDMKRNAADRETQKVADAEILKLNSIRGVLSSFNTLKFNVELEKILREEQATKYKLVK